MNIKNVLYSFICIIMMQPALVLGMNPPPLPPKPKQYTSHLLVPTESEQKQEVYSITIQDTPEDQQKRSAESDAQVLLLQGQAPFVTNVLKIIETAQDRLSLKNKQSKELFNVSLAVIDSNRIQLMLQEIVTDPQKKISEDQLDETNRVLRELRDALIELRAANKEHAAILAEDDFITIEQALVDLEIALKQTLATIEARDDKSIYRKLVDRVSNTVRNSCTSCQGISVDSCKQAAYTLARPQTWRNTTAQNVTLTCNILTQAFLLGAKIAQANQNDTAVVANACLALLAATTTGVVTTAQRCLTEPRSQAQQFSPGVARFNAVASPAGIISSLISLGVSTK
jgi:hypothetical protein